MIASHATIPGEATSFRPFGLLTSGPSVIFYCTTCSTFSTCLSTFEGAHGASSRLQGVPFHFLLAFVLQMTTLSSYCSILPTNR